MEMTFYWSDGLSYLFLWILFLVIIIFSLWSYFFARWNTLGPRFKKRFSRKNKEKKVNPIKELNNIEQQLSDEVVTSQELSNQELLKLQSEKEKLLKKQKQDELDAEKLRIEKEKELEIKNQIKSIKKKDKKKNKSKLEISNEIDQLKNNYKKRIEREAKMLQKHQNLKKFINFDEDLESFLKEIKKRKK